MTSYIKHSTNPGTSKLASTAPRVGVGIMDLIYTWYRLSANWILVIYLLFDVNALLRDWDFLILESFRFWDEDDYE